MQLQEYRVQCDSGNRVRKLLGPIAILERENNRLSANFSAYFVIFLNSSFVFLHRFFNLLFHRGECFGTWGIHLLLRFFFLLNGTVY
jgi:hypothetical protein